MNAANSQPSLWDFESELGGYDFLAVFFYRRVKLGLVVSGFAGDLPAWVRDFVHRVYALSDLLLSSSSSSFAFSVSDLSFGFSSSTSSVVHRLPHRIDEVFQQIWSSAL